jgi:hypothetical protein
MGRKIHIGNNDGILLDDKENDVRVKVLDYLYNTINLSKFRYNILDNIQKLKFLQENEHYVSPNYKGLSFLFVFINILDKPYAVLINRRTLSYHRNHVDMKIVQIIKLFVHTNLNIYSGTIFDGKIVQKDNKSYFLIQDCFCVMNKKIIDMELENKMMYLNDLINTNFSNSNVCENFIFKLNKIYYYNDIPELVNQMSDNPISSNGLIFFPKTSGITVIYIEKKNEKVEIINNNESLSTQCYDLMNDYGLYLRNRVYNFEIEGKKKVLWIKKTNITDVYDLFENKNDNKLGIAHIPSLKISHFCSKNITFEPVKMLCIFNTQFKKWIPLSLN